MHLELKMIMALAAAHSAPAQSSVSAFRELLPAAKEVHDPNLLLTVLLSLAQAQLAAHDNGVVDTIADAELELKRIPQPETAWKLSLVASLAYSQIAPERAASFAKQAESQLSELRRIWGAGYFESYLQRPDIRGQWQRLKYVLSRPGLTRNDSKL